MTGDSSEREAAAALSELAPLFADSQGSLRDLHALLLRAPARLDHPVRLAVVGQIKRGKSTLVNALLGRRLAATGPLETTFRINEFRHRDRAAAWAYYRDGTSGAVRVEGVPISELQDMTVRDPTREAELRDLIRLVVDLPEPLLASFDLIDTPGLSSIYVEDSDSTLALLGRKRAAELTEASVEELDYADAVLYLFSRDLGGADTEVVSRFLGHPTGYARAAGRALGVVSKCDMIWPPPRNVPDYNPIEQVAQPRIDAYLTDEPELGRLFYDIIPVAALVAEGARTADPEWFSWLDDLSRLEFPALLGLLRYPSRFIGETVPGTLLSEPQRTTLYNRFGPWGILLACRYLRAQCTMEQVCGHLVEDSGVQRIQDLVVSHFGKRAYLVKLDRILSSIRGVLTVYGSESPLDSDTDVSVARVRNTIEAITDREQGLWAMEVLRLIGQRQLKITITEMTRIIQLVEPGASCASRLGRPEDTPAGDLLPLAIEEVSYWQRQNNDVISVDSETREVIRLLLRTAEDVKYRVTRAEQLLRQSELLKQQSDSLLRWA
jgi:hypothetical protein